MTQKTIEDGETAPWHPHRRPCKLISNRC